LVRLGDQERSFRGSMKTYEITIPKRITFSELHIHTVEAESEEEALSLAKQGMGDVEYDNMGDYAVDYEYEDEIEIKEVV
jgi:hypothetical protein